MVFGRLAELIKILIKQSIISHGTYPQFFVSFHAGLRLRGIDSLELIYGERDWMDVRHGNQVAEAEGAAKLPTVVQLLMDAGALGNARGKKTTTEIVHRIFSHRAAVLSCVVDFL